ncbi:MAG: hypothetical protein RIR93_516, partial [Actinomycetota bacterium]
YWGVITDIAIGGVELQDLAFNQPFTFGDVV